MKKKSDIIILSGIGIALIAYILNLFVVFKEWKKHEHERETPDIHIQYSNDSLTKEMTWEETIKMLSEIDNDNDNDNLNDNDNGNVNVNVNDNLDDNANDNIDDVFSGSRSENRTK